MEETITPIEPIDELNAVPPDDAPSLPEQHDFYKMPAKFGHVPVAEEPLGWDPKRRFEHLYPRVSLPFQIVERFQFGSPELAPNQLFFGDNLHVMRSLPSESVALIYIDPPFFSQKTYNILFGDQNELRSFRDIWDGGLNGYLAWLNARLYEMKRLLTPGGCIYVHVDWHAAHYVKVELDKLFGYSNFLNEIAWCYSVGGKSRDRWARKHDTILFYTRGGSQWFFDGKAAGVPRKTGKESQGGIIRTDEDGRLYQDKLVRSSGKYYRYYLDEPKLPEDWWTDINSIQSQSAERIGYPTQKPEALIDRIIRASSRPGDVVADFFCGGGSTPAVAQRLGRHWVGCDISRVAVSITADRVAKVVEEQEDEAKKTGTQVAIPDFIVAHWGIYEISSLSKMAQDEFQEFVLAAYEARPESTGSVIHGYKGKEPIFVGSPDPDVAVRKEQVAEFANAVLKRLGSGGMGTMISWAFTQAARRMAERIAAQEKVGLSFVKLRLIPLESPEFAAHVTSKHERYSELVTFVLPPTVRLKWQRVAPRKYRFDVSESIALNSGAKIINAQWDFEYRDYFTSTKGFELQRTKKGEPVLTAEYQFPTTGEHEIAVRVQDDLGGEAIRRETVSVS
ncbi:MAG: site-specific DNA-methyltransferase [Solirubrobacteraceae bacterium]